MMNPLYGLSPSAGFNVMLNTRLPFSGAFVLNLPEAQERRNQMQAMLGEHSIPFEFMPAERSRHPDRKMSGVLGCNWTHAKCVRAAKDLSWETVLIIEDDAVLHPKFYELLPDLSTLERIAWDVFYFYHFTDNSCVGLKTPVRITRINYSIWSHFYVVHSRFYDDFLKRAVTSDWYSDRLFRGQPYRLYGLTANLVGQAPGKSLIDGQQYLNVRGLSF